MTFAVIGMVNTLVHASLVIVQVEYLFINQIVANAVAFVAANISSYFMNARWTFNVTPSRAGYMRFFSASVGSFLLVISFSSIAEVMGWHYLVGLFLITGVVPFITFVAYKYWVFPANAGVVVVTDEQA